MCLSRVSHPDCRATPKGTCVNQRRAGTVKCGDQSVYVVLEIHIGRCGERRNTLRILTPQLIEIKHRSGQEAAGDALPLISFSPGPMNVDRMIYARARFGKQPAGRMRSGTAATLDSDRI
ncbi:hypothetical protein CR51_07370 [Caballeronia megalochromosomata]|nr:hypothetical protein CR51_07370 [Caballeronia megalochromosomata]